MSSINSHYCVNEIEGTLRRVTMHTPKEKSRKIRNITRSKERKINITAD